MSLQRPRLLVVDDDRAILTLIGTIALAEGFDVATTVDGLDAMSQLRHRPVDLALVDLRMPGVGGLDVLRAIREISPRCRVVLMSGYATIDSAVEAVQLGAADYLTKPFDVQRLRTLLSSVHEDAARRRALLEMESDVAGRLEFCGMVGRGPAMQDVFGLIRRLAPHARTTLIAGDTGTGKELAARALHALGPRGRKPFVTVSCSAAGETLFTDDSDSLFESVDGGTLLLDEVSELPLAMQARLLRVVENGEAHQIRGIHARHVDVRFIALTNRDLSAEVAAGRFRSDLFYRLNVAEIRLPPLRQRREDIPYLTASFVRLFARRFNRPVSGVTPGAERVLATAPWPGNVRQLRNVLERACMLADGECITEADLAGVMDGAAAAHDIGRQPAAMGGPAPLAAIERDHIVRTLDQVRGNKAVAARLLGISRRAFYRQLERHGLHTRVPAGRRLHPVPTNSVERVS